MKKIILGMMLLMGSLSFSSKEERGLDNHDFSNIKIKTEVSSHSFNDRLLFGDGSENRD